jgi:exodeoxyribonuclease III
MKIVSWNVNGIRAAIKKGFTVFMAEENPDIVCLQETKALKEQVELPLDSHPYKYWNSAKNKKGYSGTAIFAKQEPDNLIFDMGNEEHDQEGRVITAEYPDYYLVTVYTPNSKRDLARLPYRQRWDVAFLRHVRDLQEKKPVVFCGDLNVAHKSIDLANPRRNKRSAGFTVEERMGFSVMLSTGFIDTFRHFDKASDNYTWWSYRAGARDKNIGWRLDYFCASECLEPKLRSAHILSDVHGSDHCPVSLVLD